MPCSRASWARAGVSRLQVRRLRRRESAVDAERIGGELEVRRNMALIGSKRLGGRAGPVLPSSESNSRAPRLAQSAARRSLPPLSRAPTSAARRTSCSGAALLGSTSRSGLRAQQTNKQAYERSCSQCPNSAVREHHRQILDTGRLLRRDPTHRSHQHRTDTLCSMGRIW